MLILGNDEDLGDPVFAALRLKEQGNKLLSNFKFAMAAEKYTEAINLNCTAILLANRAQALIKLESYGLAISDANEAIRLEPNYIKSYYRRASANYALGRLKEALRDFETVVKIVPKDPDALQKLNQCRKELKLKSLNAAIINNEIDPDLHSWTHAEIDAIPVERSYDGPVMIEASNTHAHAYAHARNIQHDRNDDLSPECKYPVTMEFVHETIEYFRASKLVHRKYVNRVLLLAKEQFQNQPSLLRLTLPMVPSYDEYSNWSDSEEEEVVGHFTVCGDTHGQFYDLLNIFVSGGFPSKVNPYLFNGDFVDRGSFSFETVFTLLAIKLACPEGLYLLRGNHETKNMNKIYGFDGEVNYKYGSMMMRRFSAVFNWLPVAAVISNNTGPAPLSIFVVHGGLSTDVEPDPGKSGVGAVALSTIEAIQRGREPPETGLLADLLWADPHPAPGRSLSKRGLGFSFGPDYTAAFLEKNNLQLLVRSHEVKQEGYVIEHDGKCVTIFSAPNYCDQMGNLGAYARFYEDMKPLFTQYISSPHPDIPPMWYAGNMFNL